MNQIATRQAALTMTDEDSTQDASNVNWWRRKAPATILGIVILAIAVSVIYDMLVKPGISTASRILLDFLTLGSETIKDFAYERAAIDPTPLSALSLYLILVMVLSFPLLDIVFGYVPVFGVKKRIRELNSKLDDASEEDRKPLEEEIRGMRAKLRRKLLLIFVPTVLCVFVFSSIHNQSVLIWRTFHAHVTTVAPYIDESERLHLMSRFSIMTSEADYESIESDIQQIAESAGIQLREVALW